MTCIRHISSCNKCKILFLVQPGTIYSEIWICMGVRSWSIKDAPSCCLVGIRCPYTSNVILGWACPNRLETTITGMLLLSISVAAVCLRSWNRISGSPAFLKSRLYFLQRRSRSIGVPMVERNTRSCSSQCSPITSNFHLTLLPSSAFCCNIATNTTFGGRSKS